MVCTSKRFVAVALFATGGGVAAGSFQLHGEATSAFVGSACNLAAARRPPASVCSMTTPSSESMLEPPILDEASRFAARGVQGQGKFSNNPDNLTSTGKYLFELGAAGKRAIATSDAVALRSEIEVDVPVDSLFMPHRASSSLKNRQIPAGVPGLYSAPSDATTSEKIRRRRGVCNEMVPTEELAQWFKDKLEEVRVPEPRFTWQGRHWGVVFVVIGEANEAAECVQCCRSKC